MTCDGITYRQLAQLHSDEYARRLGFRVAETITQCPDGYGSGVFFGKTPLTCIGKKP
jgi:hypothetical protein